MFTKPGENISGALDFTPTPLRAFLFFGLLLIYTFKVLVFGGLIYTCLIPISYFSYKKNYKAKVLNNDQIDNEDLEDIL